MFPLFETLCIEKGKLKISIYTKRDMNVVCVNIMAKVR